MSLASMTGFARAAAQVLDRAILWEARSVNGRGLDVRLRLPPGFDRLESEIRARAARRLERGNASFNLSIEAPPQTSKIQINRAALDEIMSVVCDVQSAVDAAAPRLDGLLGLRGVIETVAGISAEKRLESIFDGVNEVLRRHHPQATAIESLFFNANVRTALAVGQARG